VSLEKWLKNWSGYRRYSSCWGFSSINLLRVGLTRISSQLPVSDLGERRHICHFFSEKKNATRHICHISGKNVTLSHTKIFFLTCEVFCHILPKKCHILVPPVQNFFEREEMWRFGWDWNFLFSSRLTLVTYLLRPLPFNNSWKPENRVSKSKIEFPALASISSAGFW